LATTPGGNPLLEHTAQINCGLRIMPIREAIADVLSPGGGFLADQQ
jgi:hypothetical protein